MASMTWRVDLIMGATGELKLCYTTVWVDVFFYQGCMIRGLFAIGEEDCLVPCMCR